MISPFKSPIDARSGMGRWVYLIAALGPALSIFASLFNRSFSSSEGYGTLACLILVCVVQFLRPCLCGALAIGSLYALVSLGLIARDIEAIQAFGSGDHGAWEGWHTESILFTLTVVVTGVAVGVALNAWTLIKSSR